MRAQLLRPMCVLSLVFAGCISSFSAAAADTFATAQAGTVQPAVGSQVPICVGPNLTAYWNTFTDSNGKQQWTTTDLTGNVLSSGTFKMTGTSFEIPYLLDWESYKIEAIQETPVVGRATVKAWDFWINDSPPIFPFAEWGNSTMTYSYRTPQGIRRGLVDITETSCGGGSGYSVARSVPVMFTGLQSFP